MTAAIMGVIGWAEIKAWIELIIIIIDILTKWGLSWETVSCLLFFL